MKKILLLNVIFIVCSSFLFSDNIKAKVEVKKENSLFVFKAICTNTTAKKCLLNYSFVLEKEGKSGNSINRQSGEVKLKPNDSVTCSVVKLGLVTGDSCKIALKLYKGNRCIVEENKLYIAK